MKSYNKKDLISKYRDILSEDGERVGEEKARKQVDAVLKSIMELLETLKEETHDRNGVRGNITLINFGSFEVKAKKEREYRNFHDPESKVKVGAHNSVKFNLGKGFKDLIN